MSPASGPLAGGTAVTITGTSFAYVTAVTVGSGDLQSLSVLSSAQITGLTPASGSIGAKNVVVYTSAAGNGTCTGCFTYNPLPTVTGVSPASGPLVGGTAVTITGANFPTTVDSVRVGTGWLRTVVRVNATQLTGATPASNTAGAMDVVVYTTSAGTGTCTRCFTYNPVASVTLTPDHANLVPQQTVTFTATIKDAENNVLTGRSVTWSSSNPAIASVSATGVVTGLTLGGPDTITAACEGKSAVALVTVTALVIDAVTPTPFTAKIGALYAPALVVRLRTPAGAPQSGVTVQWSPAANSGWVFPTVSVSGTDGAATTTWVAGAAATQTVQVTSVAAGNVVTLAATGTGGTTNANSVHFWGDVPSGATASAFRIDLTPQVTTPGTYFEAIGVDGAYSGMQTLYDGTGFLLFSVWDNNGVSAVVLDSAGVTCLSFGGEGTGKSCRLPYHWTLGNTYRFELTTTRNASTTDMTVTFTDIANSRTISLGTIRYGGLSAMNSTYAFVEDFLGNYPNCIAAPQRTVLLTNSEYHLNGAWSRFTSGTFTQAAPRTYCANVYAAAQGSGIVLSTGGTLVSDPNASATITIPPAP